MKSTGTGLYEKHRDWITTKFIFSIFQALTYIRNQMQSKAVPVHSINPLNAELNPICHLLALLGGATVIDVSRLRVKAHWCAAVQCNLLVCSSMVQLIGVQQYSATYWCAAVWCNLLVCSSTAQLIGEQQYSVTYWCAAVRCKLLVCSSTAQLIGEQQYSATYW
jgi:uncharacterized membrane protein